MVTGMVLWGEPMEEVYKMVLSGTSMVVHSRSTNVYGTLDNDDFFMYAGGLAAAIQTGWKISPSGYYKYYEPNKTRNDTD
ncbi:MAG: cobaltochelatase subunit CobN [Candidatus Brocadiaceae bacterium]